MKLIRWVRMDNSIVLENVLQFSGFNYKLILVQKLIHDLSCYVTFYPIVLYNVGSHLEDIA